MFGWGDHFADAGEKGNDNLSVHSRKCSLRSYFLSLDRLSDNY
jgi:hypothetical protein